MEENVQDSDYENDNMKSESGEEVCDEERFPEFQMLKIMERVIMGHVSRREHETEWKDRASLSKAVRGRRDGTTAIRTTRLPHYHLHGSHIAAYDSFVS